MKTFVLLLLWLAVPSASLAASAPTSRKATDMKDLHAMRMAVLVATAMQVLAQRAPPVVIDPADFEISAWASKSDVRVKFRRIVRYQPPGKNFEYDLVVNLTRNSVDPFDGVFYNPESRPFYTPTGDDRRNMAWSLRGIPINGQGYAYTVSEEEGRFRVQIDLFNERGDRTVQTASSVYWVDGKTGAATAPLDLNFMPSPSPRIAAVPDDHQFREILE